MKTAIISGVSGQIGSYLAEHLLDRGFRVVGFSRRTAEHSTTRIDHIINSNKSFHYEEGDVSDPAYIFSLINRERPYAYFNLAAQSHVHTSFQSPVTTNRMDYEGVVNALEAIRICSPETKFYQSSTSEMLGDRVSFSYGDSDWYERWDGTLKELELSAGGDIFDLDLFQDECTGFNPQSPYAISKLAAHHLVRLYREAYELYAVCGIMFNSESPRRGENFVTQKIASWTRRFNRWRDGNRVSTNDPEYLFLPGCPQDKFPKLRLGNVDAYRDWTHAADTARAVGLMLEQDNPEDLVIGSGHTHSVRDFLRIAIGEDYEEYIVIDPKFFRPAEVPYLRSDPSKARAKLKWEPKIKFIDLVEEMCVC